MAEIEERLSERTEHTDQAPKVPWGRALAMTETFGRWGVPRCMPLPLVPCPASRRARHDPVPSKNPKTGVWGRCLATSFVKCIRARSADRARAAHHQSQRRWRWAWTAARCR